MKKSGLCAVIICLIITIAIVAGVIVRRDNDKAGDRSEAKKAEEVNIDDSTVVSYLGPQGTYTEETCKLFFDNRGTYEPYETVDEAVQALVDGKSTYAVIPQENTIGGAVIDYVDTLINQKSVSVVGEVELPISQNLLVLPGTKLEDIKTVYSHKQGIAQGKAWLEKNLPDAEVIEVSSTAEGAKMVSEGQDKSLAAIASIGCVEVYGLEALAEGIQENDNNVTRFYVLSTEEPETEDADRIAFVATGEAYDLPELMTEINAAGMNLVALHDRPQKTELGHYNFLIECSDASYSDFETISENKKFEFRYLGSFYAE